MNDAPLGGLHVVIAPAPRTAGVLRVDLERRGAAVWSAPVVSIHEMDGWVDTVFSDTPPAWTIVTSRHAAERIMRAVRFGYGRHDQLGRIAAIGSVTATYLEKYGLWPQLFVEHGATDALAEILSKRGVANQNVFVVGAQSEPRALLDALARTEASVRYIPIYRLAGLSKDDGLLDVPSTPQDLVIFPSLSSTQAFKTFIQEVETPGWSRLPAAVIGKTTGRGATELGFQVVAQPDRHMMGALVDAVASWYRGVSVD